MHPDDQMEENLGVHEHLPSKKLGISLFPSTTIVHIRGETGKEMPRTVPNIMKF